MALTLKQFKSEQIQISETRLTQESFPNYLKIVSEGDSWFDYTIVKDTIDYLIKMGYAIRNHAKGGDTLENMLYGSKFKIRNNNVINQGSRSLEQTLNSINELNSRFFLFSGGGNDIVGGEIIGYLNHKGSNPSSLVNDYIFNEKLKRMKNSLKYLISKVSDSNPECEILMHGYDFPKINGKGYRFAWINIVGPWILPAMGQKGITLKSEQKSVIKHFIDGFNNMLIELDNEYPKFHHIELRNIFKNDNEWHNEIHLKNSGYRTIAKKYHEKITELLGYNPLEQINM
ncbi:hypothetical protein OD91_1012 [Lutibacter sp. Hel_I_33_5]|uniref:hypothetical protein n=1 Tax=Lutibacter sp. Hel_I_33_5 TaxID=1566289 RepID=UPI00119F6698|nr:hypothetical protein [Lutibacter sp. Hel_I_33_5]TVZ55747.1 hypothetical protein OD91_1012 [Lutibacter sp. Hel_I_33_5]